MEWYAKTPYGELQNPPGPPTPQQANRVLNGFVLLTFAPGKVTEAFYDQGNSGAPAWPNG